MEFFETNNALLEGERNDLLGRKPIKPVMPECSPGDGLGETLLIVGIGEEALTFLGVDEAELLRGTQRKIRGGMKSPHLRKNCHEKILVRAAWRARFAADNSRCEIPNLLFPALWFGHRLFQRLSPQKQILAANQS